MLTCLFSYFFKSINKEIHQHLMLFLSQVVISSFNFAVASLLASWMFFSLPVYQYVGLYNSHITYHTASVLAMDIRLQ